MAQSLAIKYRPKVFDDVVEQDNIKTILQQQLKDNAVKNAYLFVGGAGTGKTTCARIFANEINHGDGLPIELDAASNNGVDAVRDITKQAQSKSLDSEYKIFIIDECHMITNAGWNAMLKLIEEPPMKSIFIFCTTNPEKIPKTILSRVQRYDFQRISQQGIVQRLHDICVMEELAPIPSNGYDEAIEYLAKIADGGMRDAITLLDKCLAYSKDLTLENVIKALGTVSYDSMFTLLDHILHNDIKLAIEEVEELYNSGKDIKQFVKDFLMFLIDVMKWGIGCEPKYFLTIPPISDYINKLKGYKAQDFDAIQTILNAWLKLNYDIKYSAIPKADVEALLIRLKGGFNHEI